MIRLFIARFECNCLLTINAQPLNKLIVYNKEPTPFELKIPPTFPKPKIPADNPLTVEGISLGRHLFWDPILSKDSTLACAGCHAPNLGYGDNLKTSVGVEGLAGKRNSMPLFNLAWTPQFLWDGSAATLEEQILNQYAIPLKCILIG